jgi:hypothetical protein
MALGRASLACLTPLFLSSVTISSFDSATVGVDPIPNSGNIVCLNGAEYKVERPVCPSVNTNSSDGIFNGCGFKISSAPINCCLGCKFSGGNIDGCLIPISLGNGDALLANVISLKAGEGGSSGNGDALLANDILLKVGDANSSAEPITGGGNPKTSADLYCAVKFL